ncbi:SDR family NAD(P)-dependent oxidoreductase [Novosphingobium sp.]|uniref:SDR family NAD(P)-dependent oxidoreductase n=1 Tax=Novosphingobium sp. TaxID=1874826 RepID=UPI0025ECB6FE|nr:SDR family NAD(P)-dependent oxidoreductase [Novosphingobium sp.]MCC6926000.1 SDR family NAD(P)-dependent oxidoreductase [Novosphingobium sp.]
MDYAGKAVWITGASSGIGAALARAYAKRGARLILSGRNHAALDEVAAACGVDHLILPFDTADFAAAQAAADQAWDWSGGIDVLVNNAGISQRSLAIDTDFAVYQKMIDIDLLGPICLTQALVKRMAGRKTGQIIMISSLAGKIGSPLRTAYCAAKHGLIGYADALRLELSPHNITVIGVTPGSIRTDVSRNAITADGGRRGESDKAIDNGIDPDDFAQRMIGMIDEGQREVMIADAPTEKMIGEARRTPEALIDQMIAMFQSGYAAQMGVREQ